MYHATFDLKLGKVRHVAVRDIWVHCGTIHILMINFGSSPPKAIISVNEIDFFLKLGGPTPVFVGLIFPGALIGLRSPRVAVPNQLLPIAEFHGTVDGKGMHEGDTVGILLLV